MQNSSLQQMLQNYQKKSPDLAEKELSGRFLDFLGRHGSQAFVRENAEGHFTASAFVVDSSGTRCLLAQHRKLGIWVQLGGHADGDPNLLRSARREVLEESGYTELELLDEGIFDIDLHPIPARPTEAAHFHYDVRFLFREKAGAPPICSEESLALAWVALEDLEKYSTERSLGRMREKWMNKK